jgi:hypothetical protein
MKTFLVIATAAALAAAAWGSDPYVYLGQWGTKGSGNGEFNDAAGLDGALNGNIYVVDRLNHRVQYFTSNGSFIGKWGKF